MGTREQALLVAYIFLFFLLIGIACALVITYYAKLREEETLQRIKDRKVAQMKLQEKRRREAHEFQVQLDIDELLDPHIYSEDDLKNLAEKKTDKTFTAARLVVKEEGIPFKNLPKNNVLSQFWFQRFFNGRSSIWETQLLRQDLGIAEFFQPKYCEECGILEYKDYAKAVTLNNDNKWYLHHPKTFDVRDLPADWDGSFFVSSKSMEDAIFTPPRKKRLAKYSREPPKKKRKVEVPRKNGFIINVSGYVGKDERFVNGVYYEQPEEYSMNGRSTFLGPQHDDGQKSLLWFCRERESWVLSKRGHISCGSYYAKCKNTTDKPWTILQQWKLPHPTKDSEYLRLDIKFSLRQQDSFSEFAKLISFTTRSFGKKTMYIDLHKLDVCGPQEGSKMIPGTMLMNGIIELNSKDLSNWYEHNRMDFVIGFRLDLTKIEEEFQGFLQKRDLKELEALTSQDKLLWSCSRKLQSFGVSKEEVQRQKRLRDEIKAESRLKKMNVKKPPLFRSKRGRKLSIGGKISAIY